MAIKNYLIGIGGTGARVVEAMVHLCASGLGPDELSVFIVDPDSGNGNLARTKMLISDYNNCRKQFQRKEGCNLFKTDIKIPPGEKGFVWEIFAEKGATLSNFINFTNMKKTNPDLADFASLLFTDTELTTELNEGFRGHPSIGSVVMSNPPQDEYPFKMLWDDMDDKKSNEVRVFLVGSVFGGTGAAGFPTLGSKDIIKYNSKARIGENESKILLGGAMVLPYFSFDTDSNTTEKMFVTTSDFPIATKAALQYYNEKDLGFDQIYILGDSLGQKVGKFGVGSGKQTNYPHYIEIVSSLAAFDFYDQPAVKGVPERMLFTSIRENETIKWDQLPYSRTSEKLRERQVEFKRAITNMSIFSYSFLTYGLKILSSQHTTIKESWYNDHFKFRDKDENDKLKDPRTGINKAALDNLENYLKKFVFWICSIDDASNKVQLIDKKMMISNELNVEHPTNLIFYNPENDTTKNNIGNILKMDVSKNLDFNLFKIKGLDAVSLIDPKVNEAASRYMHIFYEAAVKYSKLNYNLS